MSEEQVKHSFLIKNAQGKAMTLVTVTSEEEALMGQPAGYTATPVPPGATAFSLGLMDMNS